MAPKFKAFCSHTSNELCKELADRNRLMLIFDLECDILPDVDGSLGWSRVTLMNDIGVH